MPKTAVTFCRRVDPLDPVCAVGIGAVGRALAMRVRARLSHDGERVSGVVAGDIVLLMGETARLPWVDGVLYLGRDPRAPRLLLPTQLRPSVPIDASRSRAPRVPRPFEALSRFCSNPSGSFP